MKIDSFIKLLLCAFVTTCSMPLAASAFTNWIEDPADPIYTPYPLTTALYDDYFPCVLYNANKFNGDGDATLYKMWHQGSGISTGTLALSTSDDGIHWTLKGDTNLIAPSGLTIGHPVVLYDANGFGGGAYHYKMWFWNGTIGCCNSIAIIQTSVSTDGFFWQPPTPISQDATFPLVDGIPGSYFNALYGPAFVLYNPTATNTPGQPFSFAYIMYYDAAGLGAVPGNPEEEAIALAFSTDGNFWTRFGSQPVLLPSSNASDWDGIYIFRSTIIKIQGTYYMFYSGSDGNSGTGTPFAHGLGLATSTDGINWIKDPANPIFINTNGVPWRTDRTYTPCVLSDANNFGNPPPLSLKMWFVGGNQPYTLGQAIGYATLPIPFLAPPSPKKLHGELERKYHLNHDKNFTLKAEWKKNPLDKVAFYNVYENNKLVKIVSAKKHSFTEKVHSTRRIHKKFSVSAVSPAGFESQRVVLKKVEIEDNK